MNAFQSIPLLAALALSAVGGVAHAEDCADAQCWRLRAAAVQQNMADMSRFTQEVQVLNQKLGATREKQAERLLYLSRMQAGLEEIQGLFDREFEGRPPEPKVLAQLTHEQLLKVKALTPVVPDTPARLARDARIRELTLVLRDSQTAAAEQYKAVRVAADPQKAREGFIQAMRVDFTRNNQELLRLQAEKAAEERAIVADVPALKPELERLTTLIKMGEFQDRQHLLESTRKALAQDEADEASLEAQLAAAIAAKAGPVPH